MKVPMDRDHALDIRCRRAHSDVAAPARRSPFRLAPTTIRTAGRRFSNQSRWHAAPNSSGSLSPGHAAPRGRRQTLRSSAKSPIRSCGPQPFAPQAVAAMDTFFQSVASAVMSKDPFVRRRGERGDHDAGADRVEPRLAPRRETGQERTGFGTRRLTSAATSTAAPAMTKLVCIPWTKCARSAISAPKIAIATAPPT